jgi:serine/threonine protein kinase
MSGDEAIGDGHYALAVHFGSYFDSDLDMAADHYANANDGNRLFTRGNASRCLRALQKKRLRNNVREDEAPSRERSAPWFEVPASILPYQVPAIASEGQPRLGEGASSSVITVVHPTVPGKRLAVKLLDPSVSVKAVTDEIRILLNLRHPCVVRILGWSRGGSEPYQIHMELASNGDLSQYLDSPKRWNPPPPFATATGKGKLICDIVLGMRYVHSRLLIHRDLKPSNILLDDNWRGLIGDFGLSHATTDAGYGVPSPERGARFYGAPEQEQPGRRSSEKIDVYGFGMILSALLTAFSTIGQFRRDLHLNPPDTFGSFMQNLIRRCCSENPSDRPSFDQIFREFEACNFAILSDADAAAIKESASKVLEEAKASG